MRSQNIRPQAPKRPLYASKKISPDLSAKYAIVTVEFYGNQFGLSSRLRSMGSNEDGEWQVFPVNADRVDLNVANVAKALRAVGIKVSATAVSEAKRSSESSTDSN